MACAFLPGHCASIVKAAARYHAQSEADAIDLALEKAAGVYEAVVLTLRDHRAGRVRLRRARVTPGCGLLCRHFDSRDHCRVAG